MFTLGELLVRRKLDQDTMGGDPRYIPGQHQVTLLSRGQDAIYSFVDDAGFAIQMFWTKDDLGEWYLRDGGAVKADHNQVTVIYFPRSFAPTEKMAREFQDAEKEAQKKGAPKKRPSSGDEQES